MSQKFIRSERTFSHLWIKDTLILRHTFSLLILASFSQRALRVDWMVSVASLPGGSTRVQSLVQSFKSRNWGLEKSTVIFLPHGKLVTKPVASSTLRISCRLLARGQCHLLMRQQWAINWPVHILLYTDSYIPAPIILVLFSFVLNVSNTDVPSLPISSGQENHLSQDSFKSLFSPGFPHLRWMVFLKFLEELLLEPLWLWKECKLVIPCQS